MITNIEIDGFKSLEAIRLEIKPITVMIGLNSSGKSSVLQALGILKQSILRNSSYLVMKGPFADLGSLDDIITKKGRRVMNIGLGGIRAQFLDSPFSRKTVYNYFLTFDTKGVKSVQTTIKSGEITIDSMHDRKRPLRKIKVTFSKGDLLFSQRNTIGRPIQYQKQSGLDDNFDIDNITQQYLEVIAKDLNDFHLVPAMRGISSPSYPLESASSEDLVDSTNLYAQSRRFCSTVVYDGPAMERDVNKWITRITKVKIRARPIPDKQAAIEASGKYQVNLVNEGFGTIQLVHLFSQIAKSSVNSIIGIEEPEVHLHPKAQSELAKVLIEIAIQEKKNLIITTHSEHILYRILIEIARGTLKSEDLAIYHFKLSDGVTQVERLKPDEKGRLDKGIPDFLETDLNEFKDFLEALKV